MPSTRLLAPVLRGGYPFPVLDGGTLWDGSTFAQVAYARYGGAVGDITVGGPPLGAVGTGTLYPIGMTPDAFARIFWRIKTWDVHTAVTIGTDTSTGDTVQGPGGVGGLENERGLLGVEPGDSYGFFFGGGSPFLMFTYGNAGTVNGYDYATSFRQWPEVSGSNFISLTPGTSRALRPGLIKKGTLVYPLIEFGYVLADGDNRGDKLQLDGSVEFGGDATLVFDSGTCVFTASGTGTVTSFDEELGEDVEEDLSYSITLTPKKFWPYGSGSIGPLYDEDTGLEL